VKGRSLARRPSLGVRGLESVSITNISAEEILYIAQREAGGENEGVDIVSSLRTPSPF